MDVNPQIGSLRQVVRFERNVPTVLGAGKKDDYEEFLTTRGALSKIKGNRSLSFGEANIQNQWVLFVRFETALENDLSKSMRLLIDNIIFTIDTWSLVGQKRRFYRFVLNQKF